MNLNQQRISRAFGQCEVHSIMSQYHEETHVPGIVSVHQHAINMCLNKWIRSYPILPCMIIKDLKAGVKGLKGSGEKGEAEDKGQQDP